ncbi:MAG: hypothetical protein HDS01_01865 [Bacteroides sp.]|nr:hypothetical protein [Bacteroides sp.]
MNRKIPFHELASLLAANCNITPDEAEDFIKNFFDLIAQSLTAGETVKIKSIGTFAPTGDADNPIEFTPDAVIADTINAPFALFEPEELSDTLTEAELTEIETPAEETVVTEVPVSTPEQTTVSDTVSVADVEQEAVPETEIVSEVEVKAETETEVAAETVSETESETVTITESEPTGSDDEIEENVASENEPSEENVSETVTESTSEPVTASATEEQQKNISVTPLADVKIEPQTEISVPEPLKVPSLSYSDEDEPEEYISEPTQKSGAGFGMGFLIGILVGLALGACAVYFAIDYIFPTEASIPEYDEESVEVTDILQDLPPEPIDTVSAQPVQPDTVTTETQQAEQPGETVETAKEPEPVAPKADTPKATNNTVKDTVKKGYLLNDMAKKHYGNKCFWVYIYEENKSKIANPNRVSPGLELVIPDASKYGIDATSKASISAANEKAGKILSKYPR